MFDRIFLDPEMREIAKKFNHRKLKLYFDTHPDKMELFEEIKNRRKDYELSQLKKE